MVSINKKRISALLTLPALALAFIALVALSSLLLRGARLDLTQNDEYTLSKGTLRIIKNIEEPITLRFYFSESLARDYPQVRTYAQRVRELLEELVTRAPDKLKLEVIDPKPFSEEEDRAAAYGLQGVPINDGGKLFFGLVGTNSTDGEIQIPFFEPNRESLLEYNVAKLLSSLSVEKKPVLAMLSSLPMGPAFDPASGQPTTGWAVDRQLSELFSIRRLEKTVTEIAADVDLLMLVHPKDLPDDTRYAIDQFVLRGGRALVFVDPHAEADNAGNPNDPTAADTGQKSQLNDLLAAWGVDFDNNKVLLDSGYALSVRSNSDSSATPNLSIIGLDAKALNQKDVVTAQIESVNFSTAGVLNPRKDAKTRFEALAQSSSASALTDAARFAGPIVDSSALLDEFKPGNSVYTLIARLTGPAQTAFADRKGDAHLTKSKGDINVIVVADSDLLTNRLWVNEQDFLGRTLLTPFANNGDLVYNAVDNLSGNTDLIAVRTRATAQRPFERVESLRRQAEQQFQVKEQDLQRELEALEQKLTTLQKTAPEGGAMMMSAEQRDEILKFQQQKLEIRKALRDVQHGLNADIESLGGWVKFINIVLVPLLIGLLAFAHAQLRNYGRRRGNS